MRIHFIQHVPFETPGYLLDWSKQNNFSFSFSEMYKSDFFPPVQELDMLIIMGGPVGVYEETKYPWLKKEKTIHSIGHPGQ